MDIRFENGFTQMSELAQAIDQALHSGKRVVVEHFDLVYPLLGINADLLIGVGEEVVITRPTIFGPEPRDIYEIVYKSLPYRLMCHSAEDLCEFCLPKEDMDRLEHDDVMHGFVISFPNYPPQVDLRELERKIHGMIEQNLPITYVDENHVSIGGSLHYCTGPRIHVPSTGKITEFHLLHDFVYDRFNNRYLLVGCIGKENLSRLERLT